MGMKADLPTANQLADQLSDGRKIYITNHVSILIIQNRVVPSIEFRKVAVQFYCSLKSSRDGAASTYYIIIIIDNNH